MAAFVGQNDKMDQIGHVTNVKIPGMLQTNPLVDQTVDLPEW